MVVTLTKQLVALHPYQVTKNNLLVWPGLFDHCPKTGPKTRHRTVIYLTVIDLQTSEQFERRK